jgi:hypothetical protein
MLSTLVVLLGTTVDELAPPVYAAYPTGGPVLGGTVVTIVGKEFGRINTVGLNRVRCSWGDPRPWQQSVFATQQAEMDGWAPAESILPLVPPAYFTIATRVDEQVRVTPEIRSTFGLPAGVDRVDLLECPSHEREPGDVSLWFSLRFYEAVRPTRSFSFFSSHLSEHAVATSHLRFSRCVVSQEAVNASASRREPNLMDTGFTYMYYPPPANFTNTAITGGPIHGGTSVVIEGSGFTRGYRSVEEVDLANLIMRCRFTDRPSVVAFRVCAADASALFPNAIPLSVLFDLPTNGLQLATDQISGFARRLTAQDIDALFRFSHNGGPVRLADQYVGEWADPRRLILYATNAPVAKEAQAGSQDEKGLGFLVGGSGLTLSVRRTQEELRLMAFSPPWLDASEPVSTQTVPLTPCYAANGTANAGEEIEPQVSFVKPAQLSSTRVVCRAPQRLVPVVSDLDIALNGQDYHSNQLLYSYYVQPSELTHLTPVTAGPTIGGSMVTIHGRGLGAFSTWGARPSNARCRWGGEAVHCRIDPEACTTVPSYLSDEKLVCESAAQPFTFATEVTLEVALNDRDFIEIIPRKTELRYTYYLQPRSIKAISPTGGRVDGGTLVTIDGGGFEAYSGINVSDVRFGWGDTLATNLTTPSVLSESRIVVRSYPAIDAGPQQLFLALNTFNLISINASDCSLPTASCFHYYEQPLNYSASEPTGGPTRGGTSVTIQVSLFSTRLPFASKKRKPLVPSLCTRRVCRAARSTSSRATHPTRSVALASTTYRQKSSRQIGLSARRRPQTLRARSRLQSHSTARRPISE